jgi:hypothetical protein
MANSSALTCASCSTRYQEANTAALCVFEKGSE